MTAPLSGILVADFSRILAGPLAASTLADLGATVIKVERAGTGDDTRHWGPPWTANSSSYFDAANRSKKSVQLDLDDPQDRALALKLASRADVLVENFKDGALEKRGLAYEQVSARNPRIVYASITGFGSRGGRELAGYDFLVQAMGGLMSITGEPDRPTKVGVALVDVLTAKDATVAILAALRERDSSNRGQRVEVNLLSSLLSALVNQGSAFHTTGRAPQARGNHHPSIAPYQTLRASDGDFALTVGNDTQFRELADAVGLPALAADERFATNSARVAHRSELVDMLEKQLSADTANAWVEILTARGVPAGRVGTIADGFALAHRLGLEPVVEFEDAAAQTRSPIVFGRTPITQYTPPPRLGQHDDEIREWLSKEES